MACPTNEPAGPPRVYLLTAHVVCHALRYRDTVEVVATLPEPPTAEAAERLLWPAAGALVTRHGAADHRFALTAVRVAALDPGG